MASDLNAIEVAYRGRCEMLRSIFGGGKSPPSDKPITGGGGKPIVMTAKAFDAVFGTGATERRRK